MARNRHRHLSWDYGKPDAPPPYAVGDLVVPTFGYPGWGDAEPREVLAVDYEQRGSMCGRWRLVIPNPQSPNGFSKYNPGNIRRASENKAMAYERTKYFALGVDTGKEMGLALDGRCTEPRDSAHQVKQDVAARLQEGDRWLVVQTVALIEAEPPRPPMKITEYK